MAYDPMRIAEALERIADALERAYPPKPAPLTHMDAAGNVTRQSADCQGCPRFPAELCWECAKLNGWV